MKTQDIEIKTITDLRSVYVACIIENRDFIGIEKNEKYYNEALKKIKDGI